VRQSSLLPNRDDDFPPGVSGGKALAGAHARDVEVEIPGEVQPDEASEEDQVFQKFGYQHEANLLQRFQEKGREVVEIQTGNRA
jgi:hypothetical protein